jgi:hypothetical protein
MVPCCACCGMLGVLCVLRVRVCGVWVQLSAQVMPSQLCLVCGHRLTSWQLGDKWTDNRTSGQPAQPSSLPSVCGLCAAGTGQELDADRTACCKACTS